MYVTAIDFETAWYQPHSAIAVGISRIDGGRVIETRSWLFRPPGKRVYIRPNFIDIHGIQPEHLQDKPDFAGVWPEIAPYLESASMLVAHNAWFDRNVLYATADHYGIALPAFDWACTVRISKVKWPNIENHKLSTVCEHLGIPLRHHDPASDAHGCANIYIEAAKLDQIETPEKACAAGNP